MGIDIHKNGLKRYVTEFVTSSKAWQVGTRHREQIYLTDSAVDRIQNLIIVDMSAFPSFTSRADNNNYVRVFEHVDATEVGTEINSQTIDGTWAGGNHTHVCFLCTDTSISTYYTIYYGDIDLGASGYASDLTVTADTPDAGDYTIQNAYYTTLIDYSFGGLLPNLWTRVSGGDVQIGLNNDFKFGDIYLHYGGVAYFVSYDNTPTITLVEGTTGANAGAVLVAFKVTGVLDDTPGVGGNHAVDISAGDITYENIFVFCNCQLIKCISSITLADSRTNVTKVYFYVGGRFVNGYFSHQGYKYGATHAVETIQDRILSAQWLTKKYASVFDITSNDGFVCHFVEETLQNIETQIFSILEEAWGDTIEIAPDRSLTNTTYVAGTEFMTVWIQIDDFTEADGDNDDDGDQPAHRKNTELLTALTQTIIETVSF